MEASYLLSTPTLKDFVAGVEKSLSLINDERVGVIDLQFFPRFYFLSYGVASNRGGNPTIQKHFRENEFMGSGNIWVSREQSRLKVIENSLELPLRKSGYKLANAVSQPCFRKEVTAHMRWSIVPV